MKIGIGTTLGLAALMMTAMAASPKEWKLLDLENNTGEAVINRQGKRVTVEGTVRIQSPEVRTVKSNETNLEYRTVLKVPEKPAQWASAALVLFGRDDSERSMGMIIFNENGKMSIGFYGDRMKEASFTPGDTIELVVQVSEGEQRIKAWKQGTPEPAAWNVSIPVKFAEIRGAGLRTFAMKGEFSNVDLTEGKVKPLPRLEFSNDHVKAAISLQDGKVIKLTMGGERVEMFTGDLGGPSFEIREKAGSSVTPELTRENKSSRFTGKSGDVLLGIDYKLEGDSLAVTATATNEGKTEWTPDTLRLNLGVDTCMISYPQWDSRHFPTFLRSEKTHFWGYAMSPQGSILGIFSPDSVPVWNLKYNNGGHRINGIQLSLLSASPVPERSAQKSGSLAPGERRSWKIYLARVSGLDKVPDAASRFTGATIVTADRYTGEPGEKITLTLSGPSPEKLQLIDGNTTRDIPVKKGKAELILPEKPGYYPVVAANAGGKVTQAMLTVRRPWSWYMDASRQWSVKAKQKAGTHVEGWYGFFPSFMWRHFEPNRELDEQLDKDFEELFATMYDYETMTPKEASHPARVQNHACAASLYMERYRITGNIKDMEMAAALCDFVIKTQKEDGAYRSGKTHYTSVIYLGKSIMEVMDMEKVLGEKDPVWKERFDRHYASVEKAMDELARNLDNIETEGEMTFEDGMVSCSYTQLAQWARHYAKPENRAKYIEAAEKLVFKHRCLAQLVQPDSRMNNASLRFWESQYDVLWCKNMISSPHGWTGWRLYGLFDLYRLTGKIDYLRQAMNGLGTAANLMDPVSGELNWAFMMDSRITTDVLRPDPNNPGKGIRKVDTVTEGYIPMISSWWKAPYGKAVFGYNWRYGVDEGGGSCDNDVHEIYKCVAEHALTTTYVYFDANNVPEIWNGTIVKKGDIYEVTPSEKYVSEIHVTSRVPVKVEGKFTHEDQEGKVVTHVLSSR